MLAIAAGLLAVVIALSLNNIAIRWGPPALVLMIPAIEETTKSLLAYFFGVSLIIVHLVFGVVEAAYDIAGPSRSGYVAGLSSIATHLFFATLTLQVWRFTGSIILGIIAAIIVHAGWNALIAYVESRRRTV